MVSKWFTSHRKAALAWLSAVASVAIFYFEDGQITGEEWYLLVVAAVNGFGVQFLPNVKRGE